MSVPRHTKGSDIEILHDTAIALTPAQSGQVAGAPVVLVEFSDFQCPFCGRYAKDVYPQIQKELVSTGKIAYVFRNLPLQIHKSAAGAAAAGECARRKGQFWQMHDRLFANQQLLEKPDLVAHAQALGLQPEEFATCLEDAATKSTVEADVAAARRLGVNSTPTFFVGRPEVRQGIVHVELLRKLVGVRPFAAFETAVAAVHAPRPAGTSGTD